METFFGEIQDPAKKQLPPQDSRGWYRIKRTGKGLFKRRLEFFRSLKFLTENQLLGFSDPPVEASIFSVFFSVISGSS